MLQVRVHTSYRQAEIHHPRRNELRQHPALSLSFQIVSDSAICVK